MVTLVRPLSFARLLRRRGMLESTNAQLVTGAGILLVIVAVALIVPFVWPYGPEQIVTDDSLASPSWHHLFGADSLGRDVFVRVADGYRISLTVAVGSILIALAVGIPLGLIAGYAGGRIDSLIMRPLDVLMAFPAILLAIVVAAVLGTGTGVVLLAIGIVYVPIIARVMRAATLVVRREPYVEAALARGASHRQVLLGHVLPNSLGPVIVQASLLMGVAILLEAALSFVGLGVRPPTPSLGLMLSDGRDYLSNAPWAMIAPGVAIMLLVLSFNLIGDGLNLLLDPRLRANGR
ncbi:MAG: putative peptide transporter, ATP-binding protein [Chloroflexi bacterium]|nr:putative peptide transporter, ATP-binding protein [Chloroflexota bacterium]